MSEHLGFSLSIGRSDIADEYREQTAPVATVGKRLAGPDASSEDRTTIYLGASMIL